MRNYLLTLTAVFCLAAAFAKPAYAARIHRHYKSHHVHYLHYSHYSHYSLDTDNITGDSVIQFARTLIGVRYRSATSDPDIGFDCSGFVNYVFKNFNFSVPRSSPDFINIGEKISLEDAKPGDIIIFTSPTRHHSIGHVGIVLCNEGDDFEFIHSTSGKEHGVTITAMDDTYRRRFVQVIRILKSNDNPQPLLVEND